MGGGLMQLVAYGAQDIYLTGNPQITFFKVIYRRHTNFSMETIRQTFKGNVEASKRVVARISRNGDLVHDCFLKVTTEQMKKPYNNPGHNIINNIELEIGGQLIDKHYGHWMEAHAQLTEESLKSGFWADMFTGGDLWHTGGSPAPVSAFQLVACAGGVTLGDPSNEAVVNSGTLLYVPLRFWFNRHVGLSLPLIALQYHEVNINLTLTETYINIAKGIELWCNYIYLDTDERRRFAQVSHEYLIEQVQHQEFNVAGSRVDNYTFKLNFNHPVKELIWGTTEHDWGSDNILSGTFVPACRDKLGTVQLKLNGHDRFEKQHSTYFTRYQLMKYHNTYSKGQSNDTLAVYSFALKPEEHQPSGTCNFSRIDSAKLECTKLGSPEPSGPYLVHIYAINYNVLRIMSGMGGLAYSN